MLPQTDTDYKKLYSEIIKKQMLVLGPEITLAKVKNVPGLVVDANGDVQSIEGEPQVLLQEIINQFVDLSGLIVKKTMESILTSYPAMAGLATSAVFGGSAQTQSSPSISAVSTPLPVSNTPEEKKATQEPPSMADMNLESLKIESKSENLQPQAVSKAQPAEFSQSEMEDLNKALADLATAPLTSEGRI